MRIVEDTQPTGIRFIYYRASSQGIVPKTEAGYRKVQAAILAMRRDGALPWGWITDSTRWMHKPESWDSVQDWAADGATHYRRALWTDSDVLVEVWCESGSVAGVLYDTKADWDVPLYPIKGQSSDTFAYNAAQNYRVDPRQVVICYFGDHDPAGYEIETTLHSKLIQHSGRVDIEFVRLACGASDVADLGLSGGPAEKSSYRDALTGRQVGWVGQAVEVEAIDPPVLRARLDTAIAGHVDPDRVRLHRITEDEDRDELRRLADVIGS